MSPLVIIFLTVFIDLRGLMYNVGVASTKGTYSPSPHYAYLGSPVATSGLESASVPGAVYSNVWLSRDPRRRRSAARSTRIASAVPLASGASP